MQQVKAGDLNGTHIGKRVRVWNDDEGQYQNGTLTGVYIDSYSNYVGVVVSSEDCEWLIDIPQGGFVEITS